MLSLRDACVQWAGDPADKELGAGAQSVHKTQKTQQTLHTLSAPAASSAGSTFASLTGVVCVVDAVRYLFAQVEQLEKQFQLEAHAKMGVYGLLRMLPFVVAVAVSPSAASRSVWGRMPLHRPLL